MTLDGTEGKEQVAEKAYKQKLVGLDPVVIGGPLLLWASTMRHADAGPAHTTFRRGRSCIVVHSSPRAPSLEKPPAFPHLIFSLCSIYKPK